MITRETFPRRADIFCLMVSLKNSVSPGRFRLTYSIIKVGSRSAGGPRSRTSMATAEVTSCASVSGVAVYSDERAIIQEEAMLSSDGPSPSCSSPILTLEKTGSNSTRALAARDTKSLASASRLACAASMAASASLEKRQCNRSNRFARSRWNAVEFATATPMTNCSGDPRIGRSSTGAHCARTRPAADGKSDTVSGGIAQAIRSSASAAILGTWSTRPIKNATTALKSDASSRSATQFSVARAPASTPLSLLAKSFASSAYFSRFSLVRPGVNHCLRRLVKIREGSAKSLAFQRLPVKHRP